MKYPYIGQLEHDSRFIALFLSSNLACNVQSPHGDWEGAKPHEYVDGWCEDSFKNITAEYLANTYGEVKSKEHAEFIKLLAENHDIPCGHKVVNDDCKYLYVIDGSLFFTHREVDFVSELKQIIIPLPPELDCKESKPKKVLSNGHVYELLDDGMYCINHHHDNCTVSFNFASLETLKKASDFKVIEGESGDLSWPECPDFNHSLDNLKGHFCAFDNE